MSKSFQIDHTNHGHPIHGPEGKAARAKCRREFPNGVGAGPKPLPKHPTKEKEDGKK